MTPQSRIFETKYADNAANKFDGDKEGDQWKGRTRNYFCGLIPSMKPLLEWAESFGKNPIAQADVASLCLHIDEDPVIISHLMWNYFNANLVGAAKEIFDNVDMYQGLEVWRKISQKINVWGERRRDELAEIVNNPKSSGKVEDMARVFEAWDTSHRQYVANGGRPLWDDDRLRILKKIVPQVLLNELITKDFREWQVAKEWVLEMSRRYAVHGRPSKLLHLAEAEGAGDTAHELGEALALLGEGATAEEIFAVVASKRPWLKRKPPGAAGSVRPTPGGAGSAATAAKSSPTTAARASPTTKDGRKLCSNC